MKTLDLSFPFEGQFHLVSRDGSCVCFPAAYRYVSDIQFDCHGWLWQRPDLCLVFFVVGGAVVASAGVLPDC